jgi:hypothetical protein
MAREQPVARQGPVTRRAGLYVCMAVLFAGATVAGADLAPTWDR